MYCYKINMNEKAPFPTGNRHKRISLFVPESKLPYDIRKRYPNDYKVNLQEELQQWGDLLKSAHDEINELTKVLNEKDPKVVKVNMSDDKCFEGFFDHSLYYAHLNSVEKFCKKTACAVEERRQKEEHRDSEKLLLQSNSRIIDKLMKDDIRKYF